jgi:hypothetical protein
MVMTDLRLAVAILEELLTETEISRWVLIEDASAKPVGPTVSNV